MGVGYGKWTNSSTNVIRNFAYTYEYRGWQWWAYVAVVVDSQAISLDSTHETDDGDNWHRNLEPSPELLTLTALVIAAIVPVGVFADKLEEEFPDTGEFCNCLREWERVNLQERG